MDQRWLQIDDLVALAVRIERHEFLLSQPNAVLIAAEVRDGKLLPSPLRGQNMTMEYLSTTQQHEARKRHPPVRFMPIRRPKQEEDQPADPWLSIGRMSDSDIMINDYTISKQHARLREDTSNGVFQLEALGSTNGTWHNQTKIDPHAHVILRSGDQVRFGRHIFTFLNARRFYDFLVDLAELK